MSTSTTTPPARLADDDLARLAAYDERRKRHNECQRLARLAEGRTPRSECIKRTKPWIAAGMSRYRWEILRREAGLVRPRTSALKLGRPPKERAPAPPATQS
jgi:hypothetical protein